MRRSSAPALHALAATALTIAAALSTTDVMAAEPRAATAEERVVVSGRIEDSIERAGSVSVLTEKTIERTRAEHVHELLLRIPGVLVSRGSGQEHLTAIRSEVVTGAGSCGTFLFMEDGVPLRPEGFCNVNGLFESVSDFAAAVEVGRGPSSAQFGGNALNGVVNWVSALPDGSGFTGTAEAGRWQFGKLNAGYSTDDWRIDLLGTTTDGYRDDTGFGEQKLAIVHQREIGGWQSTHRVAATLLNQETGGFVVGEDAYENALRDTNPNPEAFRDAWSVRTQSDWQKSISTDDDFAVKAYARASNMRFLQHFAPGQPLERNGQHSIGAIANYRSADIWQSGAQLEWARGDVYEFQARPATGSAFNVAVRPVGVHYDFDVDSVQAALFYDVAYPFEAGSPWRWVHSLRYEYFRYDYSNKSLDGNTRDDGSVCALGGCLFNRPADRDDDFYNLAGRLGISREFDLAPDNSAQLHLVASSGFRPPQAAELYRLQRGQNVADLDSERLDAIELGWHQQFATGLIRADVFVQRKRHLILRDSAGFNVSDGRTIGRGVEIEGVIQATPAHRFDVAATYAVHQYDFDRAIGGGETIRDGDDADTAPRWLGSAHWLWQVTDSVSSELELVYQGEYFVDASNTARYPGHTLLNWRGDVTLSTRWRVFARVMNLLNERYADRADFAFGNFRYFPGEPLRAFVGVQFAPH